MRKQYLLVILILVLIDIFSTPTYADCRNKYSLRMVSDSRENTGSGYPMEENVQRLIQMVSDAATLVESKGEAAFDELSVRGSRWRKGETYVFIIDTLGYMYVHPNPDLQGKIQLDLKDGNGKPIIRGMIAAVNTYPDKKQGWCHYIWPTPGGIIPRWKSSFCKMVNAPSGKPYILVSGTYNDRMEREFVVDMVQDAVKKIEREGVAAYPDFHDPKGAFMAKDGYIFLLDQNGVQPVNAGFTNLEGKELWELRDMEGKQFVQEMLDLVGKSDSGWVDYMWPKAGESVASQKSAYLMKARLGDSWVLVGCGVYLFGASKMVSPIQKPSSKELINLVREAAGELEKNGENAYPAFRVEGSKWFHDEIYMVVMGIDGVKAFHAINPETEGKDESNLKDVTGKPFIQQILEVAANPKGEGWVHYVFPAPGTVFPTWKSSFVKRVRYPSGKEYLVLSGIYNMELGPEFIEDLVNHAAVALLENGKEAFTIFRDKKGPYYFMDTYMFVDDPDGFEIVNAGIPSLEGKDLMYVRDLKGRSMVRERIELAKEEGKGWLEGTWFLPGSNMPATKRTFVRKVEWEGKTYIIGSGYYPK